MPELKNIKTINLGRKQKKKKVKPFISIIIKFAIMNNINFKNITEFNQAQNLPEPENPLFTIGQEKLKC